MWPDISYTAWQDSCTTLHLWTQVIGKIRLARTPWLNHGWQVPFYVSARGLTTSLIPYDARSFDIEFNFCDHTLDIRLTNGGKRSLSLEPQTVAEFYARVSDALVSLGIPVPIKENPCEIPDALPFDRDNVHSAYDAERVHSFWQALLRVDRVLKTFRTGFIGKASPVHFFWGSFDLAVTRFSGRKAPPFATKIPGVSPGVMREAYSHEVSSAGFWPGGNGIDYPAFYSYAYPMPEGFSSFPVKPQGAFFEPKLGECLLPYDTVRTATDPDAVLLEFLQSTYEAAAQCANWDRQALECAFGTPDVPRPV